uniref:Secreted protein n=1 Tax=Panagrellus redivivus TaxID=6233 RepID=A0A7E4WB91_PANRE
MLSLVLLALFTPSVPSNRIEDLPEVVVRRPRPQYSHNGWRYRTSRSAPFATRFVPSYVRFSPGAMPPGPSQS